MVDLAGSAESAGIPFCGAAAAGGARIVGGGQIVSEAVVVVTTSARLAEVAGSFSGGVTVIGGARPVGGVAEVPGRDAAVFPPSAGFPVSGVGAVTTLAADEGVGTAAGRTHL